MGTHGAPRATGAAFTPAVVLLLATLIPAPSATASPSVAAHVSAARSLAGLTAINYDPSLDAGPQLHANYLADIGRLDHTEDPAHPLATDAGAEAGMNSVLDALYGSPPPEDHIDRWLQAPFHALELLDPQLATIGFATARSDTPYFDQVAVMDTRTGRSLPKATQPVAWPGNGAVSSHTTFTSGEWPNPLTSCPGYSLPTGHPIYLRLTSDPNVTSTTLTDGTTTLEHCTITGADYDNPNGTEESLARGLLNYANAVVLIPRQPLEHASYNVSVTTTVATYNWVFSTGPDDIAPANATPLTLPRGTSTTPDTAITTAAAISRSLIDANQADSAVICRSDDYADCLAASLIADADTPILFANAPGDPTAPTAIPATTLNELTRALPPAGTVYLLGGSSAIAPSAESELRSLGLNPRRISGADRYATAAAVAATFAPNATSYLIAQGHDWADAVAGGGLASATNTPILLSARDHLPDATRKALDTNDAVTILGGTAAVSTTAATAVRAVTGHSPQRLAGTDRAATAVAIAEAWPTRSDSSRSEHRLISNLWAADGWQVALAAVPLTNRFEAPLLAASPSGLPVPTQQHLQRIDPTPGLLDLDSALGGLVAAIHGLLSELPAG